MATDTIYDTINTPYSAKDVEDYLNTSGFSKEELELIAEAGYLSSIDNFRMLFNMIKLNIIRPTDLLSIENFNDNNLKNWIDGILFDNYLLDHQIVSLEKKRAVETILNRLGLIKAYQETKFKDLSVNNFVFQFDYYNRQNLINSYKSLSAFIDDFSEKFNTKNIGTEGPLQGYINIINREVSVPSSVDPLVQTVLREVSNTVIIPTLLNMVNTRDSLATLCFESYKTMSGIQVLRPLVTDFINWSFPYKNFNDIKRELFQLYTDKKEFESKLKTKLEDDKDFKLYSNTMLWANRKLIFALVYQTLVDDSRNENVEEEDKTFYDDDVRAYIDSAISNKIEAFNSLLETIRDNAHSLKLINA